MFFRASAYLLFFAVSTASSLPHIENQAQLDILATFFDSSRIFQTAPAEGITLLSGSEQEGFLLSGETDDIVSTFVFMPPAGSTPDQFEITFTCDSAEVSTTDSCSVSNAVAQIVNSDATAYNTTVTCIFSLFPGSTSCGLTATPLTTFRSSNDPKSNGTGPFTPVEADLFRQVALQTYESPVVAINVYGIVFYLPDEAGGLSESATIVSGTLNSFQLSSYDRTDQGEREIQISSSVPGIGSVTGFTALGYFAEASVTTAIEDHILKYDTSACILTDASISNNLVSLPVGDICGIGIAAAGDSTNPKMGVQFRTYKSGKLTLNMAWTTFGASQDSYEQSITFDITEPAPPVIVGIEKKVLYRSVPCETEQLKIVAYNVRSADTRTITVQNPDDSTSIWSESTSFFTYDASTDQSTIVFESAGGFGTDASFVLTAMFASDERPAVVLDSSLVTTLSFSTPPSLTGMTPSTSSVQGGDIVVLTGSFEGFGIEDIIYIGGYAISGGDVTIDSTSQITFSTPALASLGQAHNYAVTIGICAERSSSFTLFYNVSPSLTITAVDSSVDDNGSYMIPPSGSTSFLAEVSGNNDGVEYAWAIFTSEGNEVSTGETTTNTQLFVLSSTLLSSSTELYNVTCEVKNSLELTDSQSITTKLGEPGVSYLTVNVYSVEDLSRSVDTVTLVQSSVQYITDPTNVLSLGANDVILEWNYIGKQFQVDNTSADSEVTGPTQLGLEFNIARKDLVVGKQQLELVAYLSDNPDVRGSDKITINVAQSVLQPEINGGVNGTLILEGNDLVLTAEGSFDPDVLDGEGDSTAGIDFLWVSCRKSLRSSFSNVVEDCTDILPNDAASPTITIPAASLSDARLDTSSDPYPTFFSFGVFISKEGRTAEAFSFFELRTVPSAEAVPELSSLQVVDMKSMPLQDVSVFSDVIIQPESTDPAVKWAFDMALPSQKFLFSKNGVLKSGEGFVTTRGTRSRDLLGFASGSLDASTEYIVRVTASAAGTSLESDYEISFRTADVPTLTCFPPEVTTGTTSETRFVISAQLSFEAQNMEYCFQLVSSPTRKYTVGKGCSPLPFAEFSFPMAGTFGIECHAKTVMGAVVDNVTLPTDLVISTPMPVPGSSDIEILSARLADLSAELDSCESLKDHACIEVMISSAANFFNEVLTALEGNTSEEAQLLLEGSRQYVARLSLLSESLAEKTVYRPNQIEDSIDQALYMAQVSGIFVDSDEILFAYMASAENAVNSTGTVSTQPIIGNEIVEKVSGIANLTLSTAFNMAHEGTSRTRLRQNVDTTRRSFAAMLNIATGLIGQIRAQQETCGYSGSESTAFPASLAGGGRSTSVDGIDIPPLEVDVKVACTRTQLTTGLRSSNVGLEICDTALGVAEIRRFAMWLVAIPHFVIEATGFLKNIESYVVDLAYLETQGIELASIPLQCFQVIMKRRVSTLNVGGFENLVGGRLQNLPSSSNDCIVDQCYKFEENGDVTFGEMEVIIQTNVKGMFLAGNDTRAVAPPSFISLEGVGLGAGGQALRAIGAGIAFIVGAVLVTWIAASNFRVASAPENGEAQMGPPIDTLWEYCERDLFGRESHLKNGSQLSFSDVHFTIPDGARQPEVAPIPSGSIH